MNTTLVVFIVVIFFAGFTQSLAGFGSALISMAVLPQLLGIQTTAPMVALMAATIELVLLLHFRSALDVRAVWRLAVASIAGIPLGIYALRNFDERFILSVLGIVLMGYALYALLSPKLPELRHAAWAYGLGFLAGMLGGAYNTAGPPVIVYGDCRRWRPDEFKSNLQGFFLLNDALVILTHAASNNLTPLVWQNYLMALPVLGLGMWLGLRLDSRLNPVLFRKVVLSLLVVLGLRLVL